jgi:hypothetical protein
VDKSFPDFEIRTYETRLFATLKLPGNRYEKLSSAGFTILAGYIFGDNDKKEKISMTSPVTISIEDSMTMMFMVPNQYKKINYLHLAILKFNLYKNLQKELQQFVSEDGLIRKK